MGLTVRKRKGSKNYQIRGTVAGVYVEESAGTADRKAAAIVAASKELEIIKGQHIGRGQSVTFLEATVPYLETLGHGKDRTTAEQKRIVGKFLHHFTVTPISEIGQKSIETAALTLWPRVKKSTLRRYVGVAQAILNYAEHLGTADDTKDNPFRGYHAPAIDKRRWPESKGRDRWVTPEEARVFLKSAGADIAAFFSFLLYTGCRLSDALTLEWSKVALTEHRCTFVDDKNGDDRLCHLPDQAFTALANLRREDKPRRVFFMWKDKKALYKDWHAAMETAGIEGVTPHILCHTFGTWLVEYADANAKDLLETKRWKSLTSVMRYLHAPEKRVRAKIDSMPGAQTGQYSGRFKKKYSKSIG